MRTKYWAVFRRRVSLLCIFPTAVIILAGAQDSKPAPKFEASSVKPTPLSAPDRVGQCGGGPGGTDPGRLECQNSPLKMLIFFAYGVQPYQVIGPAWIDSQAYDIVAKLPQGTTREQMKLMLRDLLEERFHLAVHRDTRDIPIYSLVVGKSGPKLTPSREAVLSLLPSASDGKRPAVSPAAGLVFGRDGLPNFPEDGPGGMAFATKDGHSRVKASKQPLAPLAKLLGNALGRPVLDYTGLTGNYDYYLDWVPEDLSSAAASDHDSFAGERESSPDLFSALQEQLGLKLQSAKGPVEVLVVDRADRSPTQN